MLGLIVGHYFLIRGCTGIHSELPVQGQSITAQLKANSELLDELIQVVVDVIPEAPSSSGITQTPSGIGDLLTAFLMNRVNMSQEHGDPQESEWEVLPNQDTKNPKEI